MSASAKRKLRNAARIARRALERLEPPRTLAECFMRAYEDVGGIAAETPTDDERDALAATGFRALLEVPTHAERAVAAEYHRRMVTLGEARDEAFLRHVATMEASD